jgi:hypothetical protein
MVLTDESSDINPYTLGNPAGLGLLAPQGRIELNAPFYSTTSASGANGRSVLGLSPGLGPGVPDFAHVTDNFNPTAGYDYQGLLVMTTDGWGLQVAGGLNGSSNANSSFSEQFNDQSSKELVRGAKIIGPLSLGAEALVTQSTDTDNQPTPVTDVLTNTLINLGGVYSLDLGSEGSPAFLRLGSTLSFNLYPEQSLDSSSFQDGPNSIQQTYDYSNTSMVFQPSLLLDIPGTFQGGVLFEMMNETLSVSYASSDPVDYPDQLTTVDGYASDMIGAAFYKWKIVLSHPGDPHPLTFNQGVFLETLSFNTAGVNPSGVTVVTHPASGTRYQAGVGLERDGDFTLGFQVDGYPYHVLLQYPGENPVQTYNYPIFHAALGGEKWVSPHWALRGGLTFVDERAIPTPLFNYVEAFDFFNVYAGQELQGLLTSAGVGYQDKDLRVDAMGWFEQPQSIGAGFTGPGYAYTVFGGQVALAWSFNP